MDHATLVYNKLSLTHDQMKPTHLLKGSLSLPRRWRKKKKRILSEPARSIQQAFKLSTDPLAKRDDRPVSSTVCLADSASYALSFQCLFDIYLGMLSVLASAHTTVEYLTVSLAKEFLEYR